MSREKLFYSSYTEFNTFVSGTKQPRCSAQLRPKSQYLDMAWKSQQASSTFSHIAKKRKVQPSLWDCIDNDRGMPGSADFVSGLLGELSGDPVEPIHGQYTVLKFGGSSVGTSKSLAQVLETIGHIVGDCDAAHGSDENRVAVVVSAQGNTTDWLLDAAEFASNAKLDQSLRMVDLVAEQAITNAFAALSVYSSQHNSRPGSPRAVPPTSPTNSMPAGFIQEVRTLLEPLRKLMEGMYLLREKTPQGLDFALSFGERLSAFVLAKLLNARGISAMAVDARNWVRTDTHFGDARVDWETTKLNVRKLLPIWDKHVTVHTGFIGNSPCGRTTTLGRNGSDYTSTLLAGSLMASQVIINTDVSGVMTADPRIVSDAVPVRSLTFSEALELAVYGSGLFHPRTFFPLMQTGVPMLIRNTMDIGSPGTLISKAPTAPAVSSPTCVTSLENLAMIEIKSLQQQTSANPRIGIMLATCLADCGATVYMEAKAAHGQSMMVVVPLSDLETLSASLNKSMEQLIQEQEVAPISVDQKVTMLSVVLERMRSTPDVASRITSTLGALGINILAVTAGPRTFTSLIRGEDTTRAVRGVHAAFNLSKLECSVMILGAPEGIHGSSTTALALSRIVYEQYEHLEKDESLTLRIIAAVSACGEFAIKSSGLRIEETEAILDRGGNLSSREKDSVERIGVVPKDVLSTLKDAPNPILVDCSGSTEHESLYRFCLDSGINMIVSNARSVCGLNEDILPYHAKDRRPSSWRYGSSMCIDSTVGGSLPVLSTIRTLQDTGDRVNHIECALSGSINAITELLSDGMTISEAVHAATTQKYMEYDPRIDISGADFCWKLVTVAHCLGIKIEIGDVSVTPLVDSDVLGTAVSSPSDMTKAEEESLIQRLQGYDSAFKSRYSDTSGKGLRLRYIGKLDMQYEPGHSEPVSVHASIGPEMVGPNHPLYGIKSKEVYVALSTCKNHRTLPLVLRGAGQGGVEGATAILGNIIRLGQRLRGSRQ